MFWNYIKSAYRNFIRNKFYTLINILGLSIGLVAFIFILFYLKDEIGYDKYHEKYQQIHRIDSEFNINNKVEKGINFFIVKYYFIKSIIINAVVAPSPLPSRRPII